MVRSFQSFLNDIFRSYHAEAVRFAARLVGGRDNGEEVVQDAWVSLAVRGGATPIEHPKTYFFTATRNAAIAFTAREQREWSRRVDFDALTESELADETLARYEQTRQLAKLAVFLNELPPACRKAFIMNKFEGYSHPEIASRLGISVSMVEKHVVRALLHCRALMRVHAGD
ncbi:sigma-70 family RNA polymerase sigma factor [Aquamicrobium lusatiense]|uniref:RNA polymerase sigma-70 factor (ECF subfamily) n=1 Tax=Aquamicrobium lusatiense TaxID=89772 RepID=A0A7W9S1U5_9HYPH|nr:sigma-70 family RNA polymerase sigma factor [Aquamicrobium lusatiense]MBB6011774.1 RNA polymerase sigma-70 factor (ECF subfamily) [Aquamicrobium lusatiense]MDH4992256.1 sigma-70 family RNA polymerase sigma factor [Aquamicrobium lusatiense]